MIAKALSFSRAAKEFLACCAAAFVFLFLVIPLVLLCSSPDYSKEYDSWPL